MESGRVQVTKLRSLPGILNLINTLLLRRRKVHDYTSYQVGVDYVFELTSQGSKGYMTGQGKGIRRGDYLLLQQKGITVAYQVEDISYYSNAPNIWIALLTKGEECPM